MYSILPSKIRLLGQAPRQALNNGISLKFLAQIAARISIIVLVDKNDTEMAKAAICHGAKGYIPVTLGFDIAIEAVRFVLAWGSYVPIDYLLMRTWPADPPAEALPASGGSPPVNLRSCGESSAVSRI